MSGDHNMRGEEPIDFVDAEGNRIGTLDTTSPKNEFNPDWDQMAVLVEHSQEQAAKIEQLELLLSAALYALEYACDMTKPDDMSGCHCPICSSIKEIEKCLK